MTLGPAVWLCDYGTVPQLPVPHVPFSKAGHGHLTAWGLCATAVPGELQSCEGPTPPRRTGLTDRRKRLTSPELNKKFTKKLNLGSLHPKGEVGLIHVASRNTGGCS